MKRLALLLLAGTLLAQDEGPRVWVHAPAEDLLALFPEKGAGFLISIAEYTSLRDLARRNEAEAKERPPLDGRLVRGAGAARIDGDVLTLEATWAAVVPSEKGAEIPFALQGIALERIAVEEGELVGDHLRFGKAGTFSVSATLSARLAREGELRRAAFRLPAAAGHSVRIELPPEVEGETGPIVRAFKSGAAGGAVVGYPDEKGLFTIWFKPRAPARQLDALLSGTFDSVAEIGEARVLARTAVALEVLRAPVETVELALTPGQTIRGLQGKGIRSWRVLRGGPGALDRLEIRFVEPMLQAVQIGIETELPRESADLATVPMVRIPGAVRYRGTVGVAATPEVKVNALDASGARRLDGAPKGALALFEVWSQEAAIEARV